MSHASLPFNPDHLLQWSAAVQDIIGPPFEWIYIPAGAVVLEDKSKADPPAGQNGLVEVDSFLMAKYPVTNSQFQAFLDHPEGYHNPQWWEFSQWARKWKRKKTKPQPRDFGGEDLLPRTSIAWYESVAFAGWLNAQLPSPPQGGVIRLPTEAQWQRAAQGDDGRAYPWGEEWDISRCNNNVGGKGIGRTTPVTAYEGKGDSPFGLVDMAGNVWEWCATGWESGFEEIIVNNRRVLRGGSWRYFNSFNFRTDCRLRSRPYDRDVNGGARFSFYY